MLCAIWWMCFTPMRFDFDLISLYLSQIKLALAHDLLMHRLTLMARFQLPASHRVFIQCKRLHNGLYRTAKGQQCYHHHKNLGTVFQSVQSCTFADAKGLAVGLAFATPFLLAVAHNIALTCFASTRAFLIRAELFLGIHCFSLLAFSKKQVCERTPFFTSPRCSVVLPSGMFAELIDYHDGHETVRLEVSNGRTSVLNKAEAG